jgi:O-antigen ligase
MNKQNFIYTLDKIIQITFLLWALVIPWSTAGMQILLGFLILFYLVYSIIKKENPIKFHPFLFFLTGYVIILFFSSLLSENLSNSLFAAFQNDWTILFIPFLISIPVKSEWRKKTFYGIIVSAGLVGIIGIIQTFSGVDFLKGSQLTPQNNYYRAIGTYGSYMTFGGNQLFAFAISLVLMFFSKEKRKERTLLILTSTIILFSIVASFSRNAWIAASVVVILGTIFIYPKKILHVFIGIFLSIFTTFLFFPNLFARFQSIFDFSQNEGRLTLWKTSWKIFKDYPLFGIGNGNFPKYFLIYKVPGFYDAFSHAHNDFINVTVLNGLFGLIAWSAIWIALFYFIKKEINLNNFTDIDKQILFASFIGISGILAAALFQCFYTDLENNIFWWFLATTALQIIIQKKEKINTQKS